MFYWKDFIHEINLVATDGKLVLDAGAGDGHWRNNFKHKIKYVSMDYGVGDSSVDYSHLDIKGDLKEIPLENNSVDVIICIQVLEHLPEPWKVLTEFKRILKPGGFVFASCPQGEPQHQIPYDFFRYTYFGLQSIFTLHGLEIEWIKPQKGNYSKISNDLVFASNLILKREKGILKRYKGYILKALAIFVRKFYKEMDSVHTDNTIGHFVKAKKV